MPVILSPLPSFETAALLSRIEPVIQGNSFKKIERAQVLRMNVCGSALDSHFSDTFPLSQVAIRNFSKSPFC